MRTLVLKRNGLGALLMVLALSLSGWTEESEVPAPAVAPVVEQEPAKRPEAEGTLSQQMTRIEQEMAELRRRVARLEDRVYAVTDSQPASNVEERLAKLDKENQEDHRAIWDLYQRVQQLEQQMARERAELMQRLSTLSDTNTSLRQQLKETREPEKSRPGISSGYPSIRRVVIDGDGRRYIEYDR
ncbi:MAG TPA: hypothetical protein ENN74_04195 [Firmicutes bacterium]|nr:hypothetical protein [Bacillota bacterium]